LKTFTRRTDALFLSLILSLLAASAVAQTGPLEDLASFPQTQLEIRGDATAHRFKVWVADTPSRQSQGLMFVRDLPADQGMVFMHDPPRLASMWMKNTFIELDMIFIAPDGRIAKIAERTKPHSLDTIASEVAVKAVLELKGGEAARRKLRVGDRVSWDALKKTS
jgi:uncharacterized membrane protein (UPF0127 family)